jgi:OmpA-OmpF porin, OOP family
LFTIHSFFSRYNIHILLYMKKNIALIILCIFTIHLTIKAQSYKKNSWEFGPSFGVTFSQNDMANFTIKEMNGGGAFFVRKQLNASFDIRLNILTGQLTGDDKNRSSTAARGFKFESPLTEFALLGEYNFLKKNKIRAFSYTGVAIALTEPSIDFNETNNTALSSSIAIDKKNSKKRFPTLPFGLGIKYPFNDKVTLQAESAIRLVFSDYLDGVSVAASTKEKDTYVYSSVGISFTFGKKDKDKDGVIDRKDICPEIPGLAKFNGCPDSDGDGLSDPKDNCPTEKGEIKYKGCPDSDNDGIIDSSDECPLAAGSLANKGCPDSDGDGIIDSKDKCPKEAGTKERNGCPWKDIDGDGIEDEKDKCPTEKGTNATDGCPIKDEDQDKDGILDKNDLCPDKVGVEKFNGCPDSDNDGVEDFKDKCPDQVGSLTNAGCPEPKKEELQVLSDALYGIQFEVGNSKLQTDSYTILNQVAALMEKYPTYRLTIEGHTDNTGKIADNQTLSEARAKACYDYLVQKNVNTHRISYVGYGSSQPVDSNNTIKARAKNRRVVFKLSVN